MRKASSTGTLKRLADGKAGDNFAGGRHQPYMMRRSGSSGGLSSLSGRHRKVASEQDLRRVSGGVPRTRPAVAAAAGFGAEAAAAFHPGPTPAELRVAEEVVEASYARGLAAAECFELYGPVRAAPALIGSGGEAATAEQAASSQQLAASQQLASCLATPFTGTDKNMGEILRSEVDKLSADQELQTQLRYAEELRHRRETEEEEEDRVSQDEGGNLRRVRLRRRPSEESLDEQQLIWELADTAGRPASQKPPPELNSPDARVALDSLYSSMDCDTNRLTLDSVDAGKGTVNDDSCIFKSVDLLGSGKPDQDARKRGAGRVINVTAMSAPDLAE